VLWVDVRLRELEEGDLDQLFAWEQDPGAIAMAAFTRVNAADRDAFDQHYERIRTNPETTLLAIEADGVFAGTIGSYTMDGKREVTYWIDPSRWGRGIASTSLRLYLRIEVARPLIARVAAHNLGSATVLKRAGFVRKGAETSYAEGVGRDVVEHIYHLSVR
jgi:RimJ/RimL family protein N-acetyltransferase